MYITIVKQICTMYSIDISRQHFQKSFNHSEERIKISEEPRCITRL